MNDREGKCAEYELIWWSCEIRQIAGDGGEDNKAPGPWRRHVLIECCEILYWRVYPQDMTWELIHTLKHNRLNVCGDYMCLDIRVRYWWVRDLWKWHNDQSRQSINCVNRTNMIIDQQKNNNNNNTKFQIEDSFVICYCRILNIHRLFNSTKVYYT